MSSEEDSEEIYDEIDRHHMSLDMPDSDKRDTVIRRQVEVLNVEGESSNDSGDNDNEEDRNSFSNSDEDDLNNVENCKFLWSSM